MRKVKVEDAGDTELLPGAMLSLIEFEDENEKVQARIDEGETGLTIPRFVSLRSNHINARSGPGARYPIEWVYMQKSAPVEIIAGVNLPMLIKLASLRKEKNLKETVSGAQEAGKKYINVASQLLGM